MSYKFPVPDMSNIQPRPTDLFFPDRIPRMKKHICMACTGKVEGFDSELSQKEYLISGMCQKCQDEVFGASEEDSDDVCVVTFG
ncbi:MAG TPA: hypothetical protein VN368_00265 [Candidatus Methylomirabilis sp.]|nr:hypothetical protein [Candidatus Methylomirabilis sp.]